MELKDKYYTDIAKLLVLAMSIVNVLDSILSIVVKKKEGEKIWN